MTIWNDVLSVLRQRMSKESFDTWFKGTELLQIDEMNHTLKIRVDNDFSHDWIQGQYQKELEYELQQMTGKNYRLQLTLSSDTNNKSNVVSTTEEIKELAEEIQRDQHTLSRKINALIKLIQKIDNDKE